MKKTTMYIIVAVLVIIIIIAGAAAYLLSQNGGGTPSPTATPTPTPSNTVATANSLGFVANATQGTTTTTLTFAGIDLQSVNKTIRIDLPQYNQAYVLKYATMQSYSSTDGGVTWTLSGNFTQDDAIWGARWTGEVHALSSWNGTGTEYSYVDSTTNPVTNVLIYSISINPELPASIFDTPTS